MPYPYGFNTYPYQQPYQQQYPMYQPQQNNGIIWVQGESGAKSYMVAAGNTVPLWDSENQTIYIKSVDQNGMPSMRVIDYTERTVAAPAPKSNQVEYVTRKEFEEYVASVQAKEGAE